MSFKAECLELCLEQLEATVLSQKSIQPLCSESQDMETVNVVSGGAYKAECVKNLSCRMGNLYPGHAAASLESPATTSGRGNAHRPTAMVPGL